MAKIEVGKAFCFVPSAFMGEKSGQLGGREIPRTLRGTIVWVNHCHRFFLVEAKVQDHTVLRECFKF